MSHAASGEGEDVRDPLERLAEDFLERHRQGERPEITAYCRAHPELADRIPAVFATLLAMEDLGGALPQDKLPAEEPGLTPRVLGEYRILREIGRGGMGVVYEAEQEALGRTVALKVLSPNLVRAPAQIERFRQEARTAARLHHTNIVPIHSVGEDGGFHFYTMQLIHGHSVAGVLQALRRLREGQPLGPEQPTAAVARSWLSGAGTGREPEALPAPLAAHAPAEPSGADFHHAVARIGLQVAEGLAHAHGEGVLHRDIKPANVLLDIRGVAWITDFGLAKARESEDLTASGDIVGTLRYMAPERLSSDGDARSDVYSLGATLFELIALRPAFESSDRARIVRDIAAGTPPALRKLAPRVPRDLETIVLKAMARLPDDRYPSARAMADDLRRFLAGEPISARRLSSLERLWRWRQRSPATAALAAAVLLLLMVLAAGGAVTSIQLRNERNRTLSRLYQSRLEEGRAWRRSGVIGQRTRSLAALAEAATGAPVFDVRNEVISTVALTDLEVASESLAPSGGSRWDSLQEHFAAPGEGTSLHVYAAGRPGEPIARLATRPHVLPHVRFSPSSRYVGVRYHTPPAVLALWDLERQQTLWEAPAPVGDESFAFRDDEQAVAVCALEQGIVIRDLKDGSVIRALSAGASCGRACFDGTGRRIAGTQIGGASHVALILDAESGAVEARLHHPEQVIDAAWQPRGHLLALACADFNVHVWDTTTLERAHVLKGHQAEVVDVAFDPQGWLLASAGWDEQTRLWDLLAGELLVTARGRFTSFSRDGGSLGYSFGGAKLGLWRVVRSDEHRSLSVELDVPRLKEPSDLSLSPDGRWLAAVAGPLGVRLWSLGDFTQLVDLPVSEATGVGFHPSSSAVYTAGSGGLELWPLEQDGGDPSVWRVGPPRALGFAGERFDLDASGRWLAVLGDGSVRVHDLSSPTSAPRALQHGYVHRADVSARGTWVVSTTWRGQGANVWRLEDGELERTFEAQSSFAAFSPDERLLAVGTGADIAVYETRDWQPVHRWQRDEPAQTPSIVCFSPDGSLFAAAQSRAHLDLWSTRTWEKLASIELPGGMGASWTELGPGNDWIAMTSRADHTVKLWSLAAIRRDLARLHLDWDEAPSLVAANPQVTRMVVEGTPVERKRPDELLPLRSRLLELAAAHTRALELQPTAAILLGRADVLTELGALNEALADIDAALELEPGSEEARRRRAALEARLVPGAGK